MGDFSWSDIPEELANALYVAATADEPGLVERALGEANDWVCNNIESCGAKRDRWTSLLEARCAELPVPGSEFCPLHIPSEELGDNG